MSKKKSKNPSIKKEESYHKKPVYSFFKRFFDILLSFIAIVLLTPIFLIFIIIQLIATKGHPVFADLRVGKGGKDIRVLKFRTMVYDAETNIDDYLTRKQKKEWKKERKIDDDPRVTKFGKFLRKTSIDELPQLFNIFAGSMSIVGYRPMTRDELLRNFKKEERETLFLAKPGLTGYWQVSGRNNVSFESGERQKLELESVYLRGFWFDVKVAFKTIPTVLSRKGSK